VTINSSTQVHAMCYTHLDKPKRKKRKKSAILIWEKSKTTNVC